MNKSINFFINHSNKKIKLIFVKEFFLINQFEIKICFLKSENNKLIRTKGKIIFKT